MGLPRYTIAIRRGLWKFLPRRDGAEGYTKCDLLIAVFMRRRKEEGERL